jgi:hypothetical protein
MTNRETRLVGEVASWHPTRQRAFQEIVANGQSIVMAHMLASRQAPGLATDDQFLNQEYALKSRVKCPQQRAKLLARARAAGIPANEHSRYEPGLGKGPQDPNAWFMHGTGRGELQRRLNARGADAVHNLPMGIKPPAPAQRKPVKTGGLAPDLVEEIRGQKLKKDPGLALKDQRELRDEIVRTHGSQSKGQ